MDLRTKRLMNEAKMVVKNHKDLADNGITIHFSEEKIDEAYVLITGDFDTPYVGYHTYLVNFPPEYPNKSMSVKAESQDGRTRFHANQYQNGKMCYDKMNGWGTNAFTSIDNIMSVFIQVRPSMGENPLANEPGYTPKEDESTSYEVYVAHEVLRITVEGMLVDEKDKLTFDFDGSQYPINNYRRKHHDCFLEQIREHFVDNFQKYLDFTKKYETDKKYKKYNNQMIYAPNCYTSSSTINVNWEKRRLALHTIYDYLLKKGFTPASGETVKCDLKTEVETDVETSVKTSVKTSVETKAKPSVEDKIFWMILLNEDKPDVQPKKISQVKKCPKPVEPIPDVAPTMKISKRKASDEPAKTYELGFTMVSPNDGKTYIVAERKDGVLFWKIHHS